MVDSSSARQPVANSAWMRAYSLAVRLQSDRLDVGVADLTHEKAKLQPVSVQGVSAVAFGSPLRNPVVNGVRQAHDQNPLHLVVVASTQGIHNITFAPLYYVSSGGFRLW